MQNVWFSFDIIQSKYHANLNNRYVVSETENSVIEKDKWERIYLSLRHKSVSWDGRVQIGGLTTSRYEDVTNTLALFV